MRTSSSRLRMGAAVASTGLALVFSFGGQAFAGGADGNGSGRPVNTTPNDHPSGNDKTEESGGSGTQGKSSSDPDGDFNGGTDKPGGTQDSNRFDTSDPDGNNGCGNDDDFEDDNNGNCGGLKKQSDTDVDGDTKDKECVKASEMGQSKGKGKGLEGEKCEKDDDVKDDDDDDTDVKDDTDTDTGTVVKVDEVKVDAVKTETAKVETSNTAVLGSSVENASPAPQAAEAAQAAIETKVLGVSVERDTTAAVAAAPATAAPSTPTAVLGATFTRGAALARTGFGLTFLAIAGLLLILAGFGLKRSGRSTI